MNIPAQQNFSFSFKVTIPPKDAPVEVNANMRWTGRTWDTQVAPKTKQQLSIEVLTELEEVAERYGQQLLAEAGYELPAASPTKVVITIPETQLSPAERLQLITAPQSQIRVGDPTNHIAFQDGVLMQLWRGTIETWEKGQSPTVTLWEEWYPVPGQTAE